MSVEEEKKRKKYAVPTSDGKVCRMSESELVALLRQQASKPSAGQGASGKKCNTTTKGTLFKNEEDFVAFMVSLGEPDEHIAQAMYRELDPPPGEDSNNASAAQRGKSAAPVSARELRRQRWRWQNPDAGTSRAQALLRSLDTPTWSECEPDPEPSMYGSESLSDDGDDGCHPPMDVHLSKYGKLAWSVVAGVWDALVDAGVYILSSPSSWRHM